MAILCAVVGLVYVTMSEEDSKDNISDAMQKIIINYLQMIALASSLPMEWPAEMMLMFTIFDSVSSGGQHLVSPDCEFTEMTAAELFYQKQVMFATLPVIIVVFSYIYWHAVCLLYKGVSFYGPPGSAVCQSAAGNGRNGGGCAFSWRPARGWVWRERP